MSAKNMRICNHRMSIVGAIVGIAVSISALQAAADLDYRVVAIEGGPATDMGADATFSGLGTPVVNRFGEVAFTASVIGTGITEGGSVWTDAGGSGLRAVAHGDMDAPGVSPPSTFTITFRYLNLNDSGQVGFIAYLDGVSLGEDSGIWVTDSGGNLTLHAREGDTAPGTAWEFEHFGQPVSDIVHMVLSENGEVAFQRSTTGTGSGIWSGQPGSPLPVAIKSLVFTPGSFQGFSSNVTIDPLGRTSFRSNIYLDTLGSFIPSIWAETPIGLSLYAASGFPADGGEFNGFDTPKRNEDGTLVFDGGLRFINGINSTNNSGVWTHNAGVSTLVAQESGFGPGSGGTFMEMSNTEAVVNEHGDVLFYATVFDGVAFIPAMWLQSDGVLTLIAIKGQTAPGTEPGTTFEDFTNSRRHHLNEAGDIAFYAKVDGPNASPNHYGIWRVKDGVMEKVVRQGDLIELSPGVFQEVATVEMEGTSGNQDGRPKGLGEGGHIAFYAGLWSGQDAIIVTEQSTSVGIQEPGAVPTGGSVFGTGHVRAEPNPSRATTSIRFELASSSDVRLDVFSVSGRKVYTHTQQNHAAGKGEIRWDGARSGRPLPPGMYVYRLTAGMETVIGKVVRVR